jgi:hypothetical protein
MILYLLIYDLANSSLAIKKICHNAKIMTCGLFGKYRSNIMNPNNDIYVASLFLADFVKITYGNGVTAYPFQLLFFEFFKVARYFSHTYN